MELVSLLTPVKFQAKRRRGKHPCASRFFAYFTVLCLQLPFTFAQEAATTKAADQILWSLRKATISLKTSIC